MLHTVDLVTQAVICRVNRTQDLGRKTHVTCYQLAYLGYVGGFLTTGFQQARGNLGQGRNVNSVKQLDEVAGGKSNALR